MRSRSSVRLNANDAHRHDNSAPRAMRWGARMLCRMMNLGVIVASGAWIFAGSGWRVDLLANLTSQTAVVWLLLVVCWLALRRWRLLVGLAIAAPLLVLALAPNRAERNSIRDDTVVRVLTFNTFNEDRTTTLAAEILDQSDADVFTIIEPTSEVIRLVLHSESFRSRYPHVWPARPTTSRPTIVSRWPIEGLMLRNGLVEEGQPNPGMSPTGAIIRRPGGAFVLIATHPPSPRSRTTWENGNEAIRRLALMILDLAESHALPIVVGGDFNSTPTGWRSRYLHEQTGLQRGKPLLLPVGSWPSTMVWPARLAIDDVFVSATIRVLSWETLPTPNGGDHSPVRIELLIPYRTRSEPESP